MGVVRVAVEDTEMGGCPVHKGDKVMVMLGLGQHRRADLPDADVSASTATSTATWPSGAASTAAWAPTWPVWSCGWPCGSGTAASPSTGGRRPHARLHPGIRSIDHFPMVFAAADEPRDPGRSDAGAGRGLSGGRRLSEEPEVGLVGVGVARPRIRDGDVERLRLPHVAADGVRPPDRAWARASVQPHIRPQTSIPRAIPPWLV